MCTDADTEQPVVFHAAAVMLTGGEWSCADCEFTSNDGCHTGPGIDVARYNAERDMGEP